MIAAVCLVTGVLLVVRPAPQAPPGAPEGATAVLFDLAPRPVWGALFVGAGLLGLGRGRPGLVAMVVATAGWAIGLTMALVVGESTAWQVPVPWAGLVTMLVLYAGRA